MAEPYVFPVDWQIAKTLAVSPHRNKRNLESHWYPLWTKVMTHVIRHRKDLILAPQYRFFYDLIDESDVSSSNGNTSDGSYRDSSEECGDADDESMDVDFDEDKSEEEQDDHLSTRDRRAVMDSSPDPIDCVFDVEDTQIDCALIDNGFASHPRNPKVPIPLADPADEDKVEQNRNRDNDCHLGSDSTDTSMKTEPNSHCSEAIPDFSILYFCTRRGVEIQEADSFYRRLSSGITIMHECCPFVVENKPAPSRRYRDDKLSDEMYSILSVAARQLLRHCQYIFRKYKRATFVYAIAASGPYWMYALVHWKDVLRNPNDSSSNGNFQAWEALDWYGVFEIGEENSDLEMQKLGEILNNLVYVVPGDDH